MKFVIMNRWITVHTLLSHFRMQSEMNFGYGNEGGANSNTGIRLL